MQRYQRDLIKRTDPGGKKVRAKGRRKSTAVTCRGCRNLYLKVNSARKDTAKIPGGRGDSWQEKDDGRLSNGGESHRLYTIIMAKGN